jgi:hypothetical protein
MVDTERTRLTKERVARPYPVTFSYSGVFPPVTRNAAQDRWAAAAGSYARSLPGCSYLSMHLCTLAASYFHALQSSGKRVRVPQYTMSKQSA